MTRATSPSVARPLLVRARVFTIQATAAVLFGCIGCGTTAQTSAPARGGNRTISNVSSTATVAPDGEIVVRMANRDEFRAPRPPSAPDRSRRRLHSFDGCDRAGARAPAYYEPVVTFTRDHLIGDDPAPIHDSLIASETDKPTLRDGVNIIVDPRELLGELRVVWVGPPFYAPGTRWAEGLYCLHVLHDGTNTTIAVEQMWSMIK